MSTASQVSLPLASESGDLKLVTEMLAREPNPNIEETTDDGQTALRLACKGGHLDVAKLLLERKANPNATSNLAALLSRPRHETRSSASFSFRAELILLLA